MPHTGHNQTHAAVEASLMEGGEWQGGEVRKTDYTAADWASMGYGVSEWIAAGYTVQDLKTAGYTARDLAESGLFLASDLLANGYSLGELAELDPDMAQEYDRQQEVQLQLDPPPALLSLPQQAEPDLLVAMIEPPVVNDSQALADDEVDVAELLALCVS